MPSIEKTLEWLGGQSSLDLADRVSALPPRRRKGNRQAARVKKVMAGSSPAFAVVVAKPMPIERQNRAGVTAYRMHRAELWIELFYRLDPRNARAAAPSGAPLSEHFHAKLEPRTGATH
jgi:hypothetical protein